jgi:hypothetical protein
LHPANKKEPFPGLFSIKYRHYLNGLSPNGLAKGSVVPLLLLDVPVLGGPLETIINVTDLSR